MLELVLDHPITSYVPVYTVSIMLERGKTFARRSSTCSNWMVGPRLLPSVFVLDCPKCGVVLRWFRSRDPKIILIQQRYGRLLCGEQEDLYLDLASYFVFVSIQTILPLGWDYIYLEWVLTNWWRRRRLFCDKELYGFNNWRLQDDDHNFAARLDEGIGSWTRALAASPNPDFCRDVTNYYTCHIWMRRRLRQRSDCARDESILPKNHWDKRSDHSGALTQAGIQSMDKQYNGQGWQVLI